MVVCGLVVILCFTHGIYAQSLPLVLSTWDSTNNASIETFDMMFNDGSDIVDSIVGGCTVCEVEKRCGAAIGPGDKPSETGEVTLDAMIMDGRTMESGAVGCLRRIVNAIGVAHAVLKYTEHSLLVGELAMDFAKQMGFPEQNLSSSRSEAVWEQWQTDNCQPNFWENVSPDPTTSCGPYTPVFNDNEIPVQKSELRTTHMYNEKNEENEPDHDTIGMVAIDANGNAASGTTTNGLTHKIAGRVGDSPITGAGSFAENGVGAAAATGNGDIMLRLLPSYYAVQQMAQGASPLQAAQAAMTRIAGYYPTFNGAIIVVNTTGAIGAACHGYTDFPYNYINPQTGGVVNEIVLCGA